MTQAADQHQHSSLIGDLIFASKRSVFRFEGLPFYSIAEEQGAFNEFLAGSSITWSSELVEFVGGVRADVARGVEHLRVRLVPAELTAYIKFEIEFYKELIEAGAQVRVIEQPEYDRLIAARLDDYYVFDDERVVRLLYDEKGAWLGEEELGGAQRQTYLAASPQLESAAVELREFIAQKYRT